MSSYYGKCRTNYFTVTDAVEFKRIIAACMGDDDVHSMDNPQVDGSIKYGFYCNGSITGLPYKYVDDEPVVVYDREEDADEDLDCEISSDLFFGALQSLLPEGEAIIITEVGSEKMRYLVGCSTVVTKTEIRGVDVQQKAVELAREMLGDTGFNTKMDY